MTTQLINGLIYAVGIILGVAVGYGFGKIQIIAQHRYAKRQDVGKFKSGVAVVPGSMQRTAVFLMVLVLIQVGLPIFFNGNIQYLVSAGVVLGYGWTLLQQLRKRTAALK